jgi:hypothetical protein
LDTIGLARTVNIRYNISVKKRRLNNPVVFALLLITPSSKVSLDGGVLL